MKKNSMMADTSMRSGRRRCLRADCAALRASARAWERLLIVRALPRSTCPTPCAWRARPRHDPHRRCGAGRRRRSGPRPSLAEIGQVLPFRVAMGAGGIGPVPPPAGFAARPAASGACVRLGLHLLPQRGRPTRPAGRMKMLSSRTGALLPAALLRLPCCRRPAGRPAASATAGRPAAATAAAASGTAAAPSTAAWPAAAPCAAPCGS